MCLLNDLLDNYDVPKTNILDPLVSCLLGLLSSNLPQQFLSSFRLVNSICLEDVWGEREGEVIY
jgi:hypothetical protein